MDEIIFRSSQKLENLQIQLALAAQQGKILFHQYSERGIAVASEAWNSPRIERIQEMARELIAWLIEIVDRGAKQLFIVVNPRNFFDGLFRIFRNELSRQHLYAGCTGLVLGVMIGYSYAILMQKSSILVSQMQATVCTNYGGIDYTTLVEDFPAPKIEEPDDILIHVKASSVANIDLEICKGYGKRIRRLLNRNNFHTGSEFPVILGRSCSGIVMEIGQNVTRFDIGDEVYLTSPYWMSGTAAKVTVAKEFRVGHKPKRIGFEGTAGLPYAGSLALIAMQSAGITKTNAAEKRILVCGACTPIGCVIIQYCHLLRGDVTATSSVRAAPVAKALGADDIIIVYDRVTTKSDLEIDAAKLLHKELELRDPFDAIFVTDHTGLSQESLRKHCKPEGLVICTLPKNIPSDYYGFVFGTAYWSYVRTKCFLQSILGWSRSNFGEPKLNYHHLDILSDLVDSKQLQSVVDKVFQPHDVEQALEHVDSLDSIGSTIISFR